MPKMVAHFDESGDPDSRAVVVSGFVGTVDQWTRFESDWKGAHADFGLPDPSIHPFHMKDFAHEPSLRDLCDIMGIPKST
jgi:hypothetical protein